MRRKLLSGKMMGILTVLLVLFMTAGVAEAERTDAANRWKYILVDGSATVMDYSHEDFEGVLAIPSELDGHPVTGIGEYAFAYDWITGVTIPTGVTSISDKAFFSCGRLTSAVIPDSVTRIGDEAFYGCEGLSSVVIPASVTFIGNNAFHHWDAVTLNVAAGSYAMQYAVENEIDYVLLDAGGQWKYLLEDGGAWIEGYAEEPTGDLAIPSELDGYPVTDINAEWALDNEKTDASGQWTYLLWDIGAVIRGSVEEPAGDLEIPSELDGHEVTGIGMWAFAQAGYVTHVTIPKSVKRIGYAAFWDCESLTSVSIPGSVTEIGRNAFQLCESLANVKIPTSVTDIGEDAFSDCVNLTLVVTEGSYAEQYAKENDIPYMFTTE